MKEGKRKKQKKKDMNLPSSPRLENTFLLADDMVMDVFADEVENR